MAQPAKRFGDLTGNSNAYRGMLFNDQLRKALNSGNRWQLVAVCQSLIDQAVAGDLRAIEILLDRVDGKATQSIDVTTRRTGELDQLSLPDLQLEIAKRLASLSLVPGVTLPPEAGCSEPVEVLGASHVASLSKSSEETITNSSVSDGGVSGGDYGKEV